jgi:PAS domain S-box-containing protein
MDDNTPPTGAPAMRWLGNAAKILDAMSQPVLVVDHHYKILAANSAACRSFCLLPDEIVGRTCYSVSHGLREPCWNDGKTLCPARAAFGLRERTTVIHKHRHAGRDAFEEITATPLFGQTGKVDFVVEEIRNVTELVNTKAIVETLRKEGHTLGGLVPICSTCKRVRDDHGDWLSVERYVQSRAQGGLTHAICPDCADKLRPHYTSGD